MSKHQPTCQYCGKPAEQATGEDIYPHRPDLWSLKFWQCRPCSAYVGCHKKGSTALVKNRQVLSDGTLPLGVLANAELRKAKSAAHAAFDPAWRNGAMSRSTAYAWLATALGIKKRDCHIGMFSLEQCQRVIQLMSEVKADTHDRQRLCRPAGQATRHPGDPAAAARDHAGAGACAAGRGSAGDGWGGDMVSSFDLAVFVYRHRDTGEISALYREDAVAMTGRAEWLHVGSLEPRAWIEANWTNAMAAPGLINALRGLVEYERGHDYHHDRVGALHTADMALNRALGNEAWPL